ncbi:MAG: hypothetical protein AB7G06_03575 [Bdellovibrionales bacterium]
MAQNVNPLASFADIAEDAFDPIDAPPNDKLFPELAGKPFYKEALEALQVIYQGLDREPGSQFGKTVYKRELLLDEMAQRERKQQEEDTRRPKPEPGPAAANTDEPEKDPTATEAARKPHQRQAAPTLLAALVPPPPSFAVETPTGGDNSSSDSAE